jgi:hypothetical protein
MLIDDSGVESDLLTAGGLRERIAIIMHLVHPAVFVRSRRKHVLSTKRAHETGRTGTPGGELLDSRR